MYLRCLLGGEGLSQPTLLHAARACLNPLGGSRPPHKLDHNSKTFIQVSKTGANELKQVFNSHTLITSSSFFYGGGVCLKFRNTSNDFLNMMFETLTEVDFEVLPKFSSGGYGAGQ